MTLARIKEHQSGAGVTQIQAAREKAVIFPSEMEEMGSMTKIRVIVPLLLVLSISLFASQKDDAQGPAAVAKPSVDYSGMYSFLQDGEFVQVTVEDQGHVTGFVSRFGDLESDKGMFLDQFFKQGKLDGNKLTFTTDTVHGVWFDFKGAIDRGSGKTAADEAYYVIKGTLTMYSTDANKKTSAKNREVAFKSFPQDVTPAPQKRD